MKVAASSQPLIANPIVLELTPERGLDPALLPAAHYIVTQGVDLDAATLESAAHCLAVIIAGPGAGLGAPRIDFETARRLGIYLTSIPDYASEAWARETLERVARLLHADGKALRGTRLGILGLGQVGRNLARLAAQEKLRVAACDPFVDDFVFEEFNVRRLDRLNLIGTSQALVLAVPPSLATRGLVRAEDWLLAQPGTVLVHAGAPQIIDQAGLLHAMQHDLIRRAWLAELNADHSAEAWTALCATQRLRIESMHAGETALAHAALRARTDAVISQLQAGQRPAHLLIDPPCPRHILQLAGEFPDPHKLA